MALEGLSPEAFRQSEVFHNLNNKGPVSFDSIRKSLDDKFYHGEIDQSLYDKATHQLEELEKASKGEGSKGGHVIGHTSSGKAVYASKEGSNKDHSDWSAQDHHEAAHLHRQKAGLHSDKRMRAQYDQSYQLHHSLERHHRDIADSHSQSAKKKDLAEHHSSLSDDEKKVVASDKKEKIERHSFAHEQHSTSAKSHRALAEKMKSNPFAASHHKEQAEYHEGQAAYHKAQKEYHEKN